MERGKFCVLRTSKLHYLRMVAHAGECLAKQGPGLSAFPLHSRCRPRWGSGGRGVGVRGVSPGTFVSAFGSVRVAVVRRV